MIYYPKKQAGKVKFKKQSICLTLNFSFTCSLVLTLSLRFSLRLTISLTLKHTISLPISLTLSISIIGNTNTLITHASRSFCFIYLLFFESIASRLVYCSNALYFRI
jgi:hypothetical protein